MTSVLVLALDTSTAAMTVGAVRLRQPHELIAALQAHSDERGDPSAVRAIEVLAQRIETDAFGHAEKLMPLITAVIEEAGAAVAEIEAVVVGVGPGPFTGLRVGMVTAAALGDALGIPVHGVPSHDAIAMATASGEDVLVVTDARRKEVYVSGYRASGERVFGPEVLAPADIEARIAALPSAPRSVIGAGAALAAGTLGLPVREHSGLLAGAIVELAAQPLLTSAVPGPLTPLYLRRPDATEPHAPKPALPGASRT